MRIRQQPQTEKLSISLFERAWQLFSGKSWPRTGAFDETYFDDFCGTLAHLSPDQAEMLINLTRDFLWVQDTEYIRLFSDVFDDLIGSLDKNLTIFILPMWSDEDFGKPNSSASLLYLIKCRIPAIQKKYKNWKISLLDSPKGLAYESLCKNTIFCLIDDFVGSGDTAIGAAQYYTERGVLPERVVILTLVAMRQGMEKIKQTGLQVFANIVMDRAISDRKDGNRETYQAVMEGIEDCIRVKEEYRMGYAQSEALVRMFRTPNNTFPIYWLKNSKNPCPPFPR